MSAISKIVQRLNFIASSEDTITRELMENNVQEIELLQTDQLEKGLDAFGNKIRPKYRNKKYAAKKNAKNSKPGLGTPDLKLTGKYHSKMQANIKSNEAEIINTDSKDKDLTSKYGVIKGLNENSKVELRKFIFPQVLRTFKRLLQ